MAITDGASTLQPQLSGRADRHTNLMTELLEAFELSQVQGTLLQFKPDQQVMDLQSSYGHTPWAADSKQLGCATAMR